MFSGCVLNYKDVSHEFEYTSFVKSRYVVRTEMYIWGVNAPPGYGNVIDYYSISPVELGRITGREILSESILQPGTVLEIQKIKESMNHLPGYRRVAAIVLVDSFDNQFDAPIEISLEHLLSTKHVKALGRVSTDI
ncbi:Unannotated [Lentimonas sp. CC4]|nr:Unannotated [Lentimonas sp. CC4]CAA6687114.1 Unannotated [Lentimonas sp. CC6]CAA7075539.1 Unannotated [Lentimonas sp. CC4]CAA7170306.1 Unannotated [Lentimonas sp. CC21]CAA7182600.1 Unannotated [Lentimonas sp. CC8]